MLGKLVSIFGKGTPAKVLAIVGITAVVSTTAFVTSNIVNNRGPSASSEPSGHSSSDTGATSDTFLQEEDSPAYLTGDLDIEKIPSPPRFTRTMEYRLPMKVEKTSSTTTEKKTEAAATFVYPSFDNQGEPWDLFTNLPEAEERVNITGFVGDLKINQFRDGNIEKYKGPPMVDAFVWTPENNRIYAVCQFHAGYPNEYHRFYYEISPDGSERKLVAERSGGYGRDNREGFAKEMEQVFSFQTANPRLAELENNIVHHLVSPDRQNRFSLVNISGLSFVQIKANTNTEITYQSPADSTSGKGRQTGIVVQIPFSVTDRRNNRLDNVVVTRPAEYASWSPDGQWIAVHGHTDQKLMLLKKDCSEARLYFEDLLVGTIKEWYSQQPLSWDEGEKAWQTLKYGSGNYFDNMRDLSLKFVTEGNDVYANVGQISGPLRWSPDGKYIAFYTTRFVAENKWANDFFVLRFSDGKTVRLNHENFCSARTEHRLDFRFSPDGGAVAFARMRCGDTGQTANTVAGWGIYTAKLERLFEGEKFEICGFIREFGMDDPIIEYTGVNAGYTTPFLWVGEGERIEKTGFELVVPANSGSGSELASIKYRHDALEKDLEKALKDWSAGKEEETLNKIGELRSDICFSEKEFFENSLAVIDDFAWDEMDRQMQAFRDRIIQLQRDTTAAYDALGKYNYGTYLSSYNQYSNEEKIFKDLQIQILTTLNLWNAFNATLIKHHGMKAREIEVELRRHGLTDDPGEHLKALCRRLAAIQLDQGERGLIRQQIMQEATFLAQRSYFYGLRATRDAHENIKPTTTKQAVQELFFKNGKYFVTATGGIWSGVIDLLKVTYIPETVREWIGLETLAEKTDKEIVKLRQVTADKIATLDKIRAFSDEEFLELRHYLRGEGGFSAELEKELNALRDDRNFHEETDGGLYRVAGAYDTNLTDKLTTEYTAASKHGELSLADMQKSLNLQIGLTDTGDFTFKVFLDPMKFVESMSRSLRGEWDQKGEYLGFREGLVIRMKEYFTFWRDRDYAFEDFETRKVKVGEELQDVPTTIWQNHQEMLYRYPDYIQFMMRRQALLYDYEQMELAVQCELSGEEEDADNLKHLQELKGFVFELRLQPLLARALKLEGVDRIVCRDYQGGLAKLKEAAKTDPAEMDPEDLKRLESDLTGMMIRDDGISVFQSVGNTTFYALLLGRITGSAGFTENFAFSTKGFLNYIWIQACPFDGFTSIDGLFRIWVNATKAVTAEALASAGVKSLDAAGVDGNYYRPFLDKLAIAITELGAQRIQEASYPILERSFGRLAKRLTETIEEIESARSGDRISLVQSLLRSRLGEKLLDYVDVVKALKQLRDYSDQLRKAYELKSAQVAVLRGRVKSIEEYLFQKTNPLTSTTIMRALRRYNETAGDKFDPRAAVDLFKQLPIKKLRQYKQHRAFFKRNQGIERQLDQIRCRLCDHAREQVANQFKDYVLYIAPSGTPPGNSEYRYLDSDNDYTFLLRPDIKITDQKRAEIEAAFGKYFTDNYEINSDQLGVMLDSFAFCDIMPDPQKIRDANQYMVEFQRNIENPERYILPGTVKFIPLFLFRKAGILQKVDGGKLVTLSAAETDRIFGHIELQEHNAADIIHDQLRFIEHYWQDYRANKVDVVKFLKAQGKYSLRALLAYNLTSARGRDLHNAFVPSERQTFHQAIRDIALELYPDNPEIRLLASEWYLLKTGIAIQEVFRQRMSETGLDLGASAQQHIVQGNKVMGEFIARAVPIQQQYMNTMWGQLQQLRSRYSIEQIMRTPEMRADYLRAEYEYYSAVVSNGWVLSKLSSAEKTKLLTANPASRAYLQPANEDVNRVTRYYQLQDQERNLGDSTDIQVQ
jgi:hypothetical protein